MTIRLLAPDVASQIAAGEVIERPASVVKELMENAIDSGARSISVTVLEAGRKLIEVADDGCGIAPDELPLAVSRHATSKLSNAADLFHIATLGFRGEALASIASVSRLTLTTRMGADSGGARLRVEAGHAARVEPVGAPGGTLVRVEDLFFNVPARLKFLKTDVTERRAIDGLLTRYALAYPSLRFKVTEENAVTLETAGDGDRRAILASLHGVDIARQLLELTAQEPGMRLTGYMSPIAVTRSNRRDITVFVNGRWVQDTPLTSAFIQAYHTLLMVGRYPMGALFLEIEPEDVDVNVHPAKAEVRFKNADRVFGFVQRAVRRGLLAYSPVPALEHHPWAAPDQEVDPSWAIAHSEIAADGLSRREAESAALPTGQLPLLRPLGQIGGSYVVAEGPDGLYLIDQHAAHERILFERLLREHEGRKVTSQALLAPAVVTLPPEGASLLASQLPVLLHLGFVIEEFGPSTFQVRSIPALFGNVDPTGAVQAVVEDFEEDEEPLQGEIEKKLAARVCKRMAVKAGQPLSSEEQRALVADLETCESPRTCPHGRPTMIHLSVDMLERQFGRRGPR